MDLTQHEHGDGHGHVQKIGTDHGAFQGSSLLVYASHHGHHEHHHPQPYKFGYEIKDHHGSQHRHEHGDGHGHVQGSYGFTDHRGIHREVHYVADHQGFRATVKTNEPGTANQDPAHVKLHSNAHHAAPHHVPQHHEKHHHQPQHHGHQQHHHPQPYKFGYQIKDHHGSQHRHEHGDGHGHVQGSYGFTDHRGIHREVHYVADHQGFRATVKTNEPGTANQDPAHVKLHSNAHHAASHHVPQHHEKHHHQPQHHGHQQVYHHQAQPHGHQHTQVHHHQAQHHGHHHG
ncbi:cuticle protein 16.8 [Trichonephila inaurata madagascariensis]|uniref:Cuticle protein 16.8 n=1 Tax=Trichonephila inaurata madagascariensis TaxID=2747483 RepID=A0A8X6I3J1_9ARAC|nr:cuticle protein 16.8 [Trichonephila inaurata madagascariensis]